ncbi:MAG: FAD-binding oxidoreductase [Sterolibacteriaceae bacterium]|nr:FAD-binding oxidoreductase [Candidatus Methylophosphatis haderslevensis]
MTPAALLSELRAVVGESAVFAVGDELAPYLVDWRGRYSGAALAVVKPASSEEVSRVVEICARDRVPVVPQGGNTGLVGGGTPLADGQDIVLNLSRMNKVRDLDPANNTITVEAGCILQDVQQAAQGADRLFPLSLASQGSCEIGGNLSTNAGGVHVLRYGNMRDLVLGLEVVLPDGRIWNGLRALRKDNTGYDLKHLFIGAEGTLGVITAAVLKLFARPRVAVVCWLAIDSAANAVQLLSLLRGRFGERVTAFEVVGAPALELVLRHIPGARKPLASAAPWSCLIEVADSFDGYDLAAAVESELGEAATSGLIRDAAIARSEAQAAALWAMRENISEAQKIEGISIKHDVSVPVSRIPVFLDLAESALRREFPDLRIVAFGHIGDGNLHYNLSKPVSADNAAFISQSGRVNRIVHDLVGDLGGSISAEHGLGQLKRGEILRYKSTLEIELMKTLKNALDPAGLFNRGKLL